MIDTVTLTGDYIIDDGDLSRIEWNNKPFSYEADNGLFEDVYKRNIKGEPVVKYYAHRQFMKITTSVPKFLYGNNLGEAAAADISEFPWIIDKYLREKFYAHPQHSPFHLKVSRMDVCHNFQVGGAVRDYVKAFSSIHIPKYSTCVYGSNKTVVWSCKSKRMQFYDKEREILDHGGGAELAEQAKGILRFEANVSTKAGKLLEKYSQFRWAGELLREDVAKSLLLYHLNRLGIHRMSTINNKYQIARILEEVYGVRKTLELLGFIVFLEVYGQDSLKKIPRSTFDRKMARLRDLGLAPVFSEVELTPLDLSPLIA